TVSAGAGSNVVLSYEYPTVLVDGASNELPVIFSSGWSEENDNNATGVVNIASDTNIENFPENPVVGVNLIYVMLGGTVSPINGQAPGLYTADVTLTAEYN